MKKTILLTAMVMVPAYADNDPVLQPIPLVVDNQVVVENAVSDNRGVIHTNVSAGDFNQSINATVIAIGKMENTGISIQQHHQNLSLATAVSHTDVHIGAGSFNGNIGILGVNLISGSANQAANTSTLMPGVVLEQDDNFLSAQSSTNTEALPGSHEGSVSVSPESLGGNHGIVQLSAVSGNANQVMNRIQIRLPER